jgi:hypothetical protein
MGTAMAAARSPISRDEALVLYLRIGGRRSLTRLHRHITETTPAAAVCLRTLKEWSRRYSWTRRAAEFDADAAHRLVERAQRDIVEEQFDRIRSLRIVAKNCLEAAGAIEIDLSSGTAAEVRTLTTAAIDAIKMIEVLTGGVSDRTETAPGIAAEAKQLRQKLERQKRAGTTPHAPRLEEETRNGAALIAGVAGNGPPALTGESQPRSAVPYAQRARGPS